MTRNKWIVCSVVSGIAAIVLGLVGIKLIDTATFLTFCGGLISTWSIISVVKTLLKSYARPDLFDWTRLRRAETAREFDDRIFAQPLTSLISEFLQIAFFGGFAIMMLIFGNGRGLGIFVLGAGTTLCAYLAYRCALTAYFLPSPTSDEDKGDAEHHEGGPPDGMHGLADAPTHREPPAPADSPSASHVPLPSPPAAHSENADGSGETAGTPSPAGEGAGPG